MRWVWGGLITVFVTTTSSPSAAQNWHDEADQSTTTSTAEITDLVILKDGAEYRGVVLAKTPGESVAFLLPDGSTQTFPWSELVFVGPATERPTTSSTPELDGGEEATEEQQGPPRGESHDESRTLVEVQGGEATVSFEAEGAETITFYNKSSTAVARLGGFVATAEGYTRICTTPCQATLPAGSYEIAIARSGDRTPAESEEAVYFPAGHSVVRGSYDSKKGLRIAGWAIWIGGGATGLAIAYGTMVEKRGIDAGGALLGGAIFAASTLTGALLVFTSHDESEITVTPVGPLPLQYDGQLSFGESESRGWDAAGVAPGLTLSGRF